MFVLEIWIAYIKGVKNVVLKYSMLGKDPQVELAQILDELGIAVAKAEVMKPRPGSSFKLIFAHGSAEQIEALNRELLRLPAISMKEVVAPVAP